MDNTIIIPSKIAIYFGLYGDFMVLSWLFGGFTIMKDNSCWCLMLNGDLWVYYDHKNKNITLEDLWVKQWRFNQPIGDEESPSWQTQLQQSFELWYISN
jgi:hypothetical protein